MNLFLPSPCRYSSLLRPFSSIDIPLLFRTTLLPLLVLLLSSPSPLLCTLPSPILWSQILNPPAYHVCSPSFPPSSPSLLLSSFSFLSLPPPSFSIYPFSLDASLHLSRSYLPPPRSPLPSVHSYPTLFLLLLIPLLSLLFIAWSHFSLLSIAVFPCSAFLLSTLKA